MADVDEGRGAISPRLAEVLRHEGVLLEALDNVRRQAGPEVCDLQYGNPKEDPLPGLVEALHEATRPRGPDTFAYLASDPSARRLIAEGLETRFGIRFESRNVCLTCGAFGALAAVFSAVVGEGDEVIVNRPSWWFYGAMVRMAGGTPLDIDVSEGSWDLDLAAIRAALGERTRAVVVNSPNNPTGRIYPAALLEELARMLTEASGRYGRRIYLVSDESYSRIVYDGRPFVTATSFYPDSFLVHTYLKTLLAPGLRIGYVALPPSMRDRVEVRRAIEMVQLAGGWLFPSAILQYAIGAFESLSIDVAALQRRRDRLVEALRAIGYRVHVPEATFYVLPEAPGGDGVAFTKLLERHGVLVVPMAGHFNRYFRISLTATDATIERSLTGFRAAYDQVQG